MGLPEFNRGNGDKSCEKVTRQLRCKGINDIGYCEGSDCYHAVDHEQVNDPVIHPTLDW